jgi:Na+-transporting NADH:ubiquinone oxidoreductase subunit NqrF
MRGVFGRSTMRRAPQYLPFHATGTGIAELTSSIVSALDYTRRSRDLSQWFDSARSEEIC